VKKKILANALRIEGMAIYLLTLGAINLLRGKEIAISLSPLEAFLIGIVYFAIARLLIHHANKE
jgi:hypothetical protein